ncbi:MAG: hypothetical protein P8078_03280 [bacterium]
MKSRLIIKSSLVIIYLLAIFFTACDEGNKSVNENEGETNNNNTYDIETKGIPRFVGVNYIELEKIYRISKFRSGVGHDYSDDFESCRSMKHYFQPKNAVDWTTVKIFSPVSGTVTESDEGWAGTQVRIQCEEYPAFYFILFHVNLTDSLEVDDQVTAGQQLGNHIGSQTMSDIAVGVNTLNGWKLISYFEVMIDSLFQDYQARGLNSRDEIIISRDARDADSLICAGERFTNDSKLEDWVILN